METSMNMRATPHEAELGGKRYQLLFDMAAFACAEQVYYMEYGRKCNCGEIIIDMLDGLTSALMALTYGALRSGGAGMSYRQFAQEIMTYTQYDALFDVAEKALIQAMGVEDTKEQAQEDAKN